MTNRYLDVELPEPGAIRWVFRLVRLAWAPLTVAVLGRWVETVFQVAASSFVAFVVSGPDARQGFALPQSVADWLADRSSPIPVALGFALATTLLAGAASMLVGWTTPWVHLHFNRHLTPRSLEATLSTRSPIDASTAVQRWLCKVEVVTFVCDGIVGPIGYIGSIVIALVATWKASTAAGAVGTVSLFVWAISAWFLTARAIRATRASARAHEDVGRILRDGVALRTELSRPSLHAFWIRRSLVPQRALEKGIRDLGIWNTALTGLLNLVARGVPIAAVLAAALTGGSGAAVAVLLYLGRLSGPMQSLTGVLPWVQQNLVAIQRVYQVLEKGDAKLPVAAPPMPAPRSVEIRGWRIDNGADTPLTYPDFSASAGEILFVVGPSGSGKSRLLGTIAGVESDARGELWVDGVAVVPDASAWAETRVLVPQEPELLPGTVADNLDGFPGWAAGPALRAAVEVLYQAVPPETACATSGDGAGVSVGQRRTIAVLRALGMPASVVLLDEPFAGVDDGLFELVRGALGEACTNGKVIVVAGHVHDVARAGAVRVVSLESEQSRASG